MDQKRNGRLVDTLNGELTMNLHSIARPEPTRWWPLVVNPGQPCDAAYTKKFCHYPLHPEDYGHHGCLSDRFGGYPVYCECVDCLNEQNVHYIIQTDGAFFCPACRNGDHPR